MTRLPPRRAASSTRRALLVVGLIAAIPVALIGQWPLPSSPVDDTSDFSLIVLPDTQRYTESATLSSIFVQQTEWIAANRDALNVKFVTHLGDLVEQSGNETQWIRARAAMTVLDAAAPPVPYGVLPGNHDTGSSSLYNVYFGTRSGAQFGVTNFEDYPWWGGHMPTSTPSDNRMNYQLFTAGGVDYLIVHISHLYSLSSMDLETTLSDEAGDSSYVSTIKARLRWVNTILEQHAGREAILVFHEFLRISNGLAVRAAGADFIFRHVIEANPNVFLVLNGHELGKQAEARRSDLVGGRPVHQILSNYQSRSNGGDGWFRIMRFSPQQGKIFVKTYSPRLDTYESDENSEFELVLEPRDQSSRPGPPRNVRFLTGESSH